MGFHRWGITMSSVIINRRQQELILDLPCITFVGEEFYLKGNRFHDGSLGRVAEVLGQSVGYTRARISVYSGRILPEARATVVRQPNERVENTQKEQPAFVEVDRFDNQAAGGSWPGMDNDPSPRSGDGNMEMKKVPEQLVEQGDGPVIMIKGDDSPSSLSVPDPDSSQGNQFRRIAPSSCTNAVSAVLGSRTNKQGPVYSQQEAIEDEGGIMFNEVGAIGGRRLRSGR